MPTLADSYQEETGIWGEVAVSQASRKILYSPTMLLLFAPVFSLLYLVS